jgi:hypothetical protein
MGGHAFAALLGPTSKFPRMNKTTYQKLKSFVSTKLATAYSSFGIASEDPEKLDYGDLDVVLNTNTALSPTESAISDVKEELKALLLAQYSVTNGTHFVSYAIPATALDQDKKTSQALGDGNFLEGLPEHSPLVPEATQGVSDENTYYQVDFNLTQDESQKDSILFYNSYGDLGIILCMVTKTIGTTWSKQGLRVRV